MVKLVYTRALGARGAIRESSSLSIPTKSSPKANGRDENAPPSLKLRRINSAITTLARPNL